MQATCMASTWWYTEVRNKRRVRARVPMISTLELVPVYSFPYLMVTTENVNILKRLAFSSESPVSSLQSQDDT